MSENYFTTVIAVGGSVSLVIVAVALLGIAIAHKDKTTLLTAILNAIWGWILWTYPEHILGVNSWIVSRPILGGFAIAFTVILPAVAGILFYLENKRFQMKLLLELGIFFILFAGGGVYALLSGSDELAEMVAGLLFGLAGLTGMGMLVVLRNLINYRRIRNK